MKAALRDCGFEKLSHPPLSPDQVLCDFHPFPNLNGHLHGKHFKDDNELNTATDEKWLQEQRKEGNVLFNDALNTFYLWLYGVRHMVKDHSDSEKGKPLPPHMLLFPISSKGSFICTIP